MFSQWLSFFNKLKLSVTNLIGNRTPEAASLRWSQATQTSSRVWRVKNQQIPQATFNKTKQRCDNVVFTAGMLSAVNAWTNMDKANHDLPKLDYQPTGNWLLNDEPFVGFDNETVLEKSKNGLETFYTYSSIFNNFINSVRHCMIGLSIGSFKKMSIFQNMFPFTVTFCVNTRFDCLSNRDHERKTRSRVDFLRFLQILLHFAFVSTTC